MTRRVERHSAFVGITGGYRKESSRLESVSFINCEDDGTDQIVAFALTYGDMEITSLTLLRTPKFEAMLDEAERGVSVSMEGKTVDDFASLAVVRLRANLVTIETQASRYALDVSRVDPTEVSEMKALIERMNFDHKLAIEYLKQSD